MAQLNLVFLHGGPGLRDYLAPFFRGEFPEDFTLHFYDQARGPSVDVAALVGQLDEIVQVLEGAVYLLGHSWGGTLALEYMRQPRPKVRGLILVDACLENADFYEEFEAEKRRLNIGDEDSESIFFSEDEKVAGRNILPQIYATLDADLFARFEPDYLHGFDLSNVLRGLRIPVLSLYGGCDVRIPARRIARFVELNSNIRSIAIAGAGHFPFLLSHRRDVLVKEICRFVQDPVVV